MESKGLTWKELRDRIDTFTEEELNSNVILWAEEQPMIKEVVLGKADDDFVVILEDSDGIVYDLQQIEDEVEEEDYKIVAKKGTLYLC